MECFSGGGHPRDCIGSPRVASGCFLPQEKRCDEACFKSIRRCTSWSRISRSKRGEGHSKDCIGSPWMALGHCPHRSRDIDAWSLLLSPMSGCTNWSRTGRSRVGWQRTSNFLRVPNVRTSGGDHEFRWPILSEGRQVFVKAGIGRSDLHLKTVQKANKQMQFQEQDQEEETLLDQYQMLGVTGSTVS